MLTPQARTLLECSDLIVGYSVYLDLLREEFPDHEMISTPMKREEERCRICFDQAMQGRKVVLVCSGDAGIYGMASLMYTVGVDYPLCTVGVIPGITAASSGAAELGAPVNHDFCVISLSDLLTPWEVIEKRLIAAARGDFAIVLYNPASKHRPDYLRKACDILLQEVSEDRICGFVRNIGRDGTATEVMQLKDLRNAQVDMFTTVFIGNSGTKEIDGRMVTPRGYRVEE